MTHSPNESAFPGHQPGARVRRGATTPAYYLQRPASVWRAALDQRSPTRPH